MMFLLLLSVLILWLTGFLFVGLLWPGRGAWSAHLSLKVFLGLAFGFGISSGHLFLWLMSGRRAGGRFIAAEIMLALALLGALWYRLSKGRAAGAGEALAIVPPKFRLRWLLAAACYLTLACAFVLFIVLSAREPHGQFDAVAMWNTKARMIFRGGAR